MEQSDIKNPNTDKSFTSKIKDTLVSLTKDIFPNSRKVNIEKNSR